MGTQDRRFGAAGSISAAVEKKRLSLQEKLDARKTIEERRRLGQFATPMALARNIVAFGLKHMDTPEDIRFFDPAFGTGSFYSALLQETAIDTITEAAAVEIDPLIADTAASLWLDYGVRIINADFTEIAPDSKYNLVICNPPYVRHHLIEGENKARIKEKTEEVSGFKLSGLAGLYCHFLLQSIQWMAENAVSGWLIPSEFMDVNYGKAMRSFLTSEVELFRVHRFSPDDVQFGDALVSSVVVWFRNKKPVNQSVTFSFGGSLICPQESKKISLEILRKESKWTRFPRQPQREAKPASPKLKDFFDVKRGIATGSNAFFIMDEERIHELKLPFEFFRPVLPSARYVKTAEIEADEYGNPILPRRLFLLDCRLNEKEVQQGYPELWRYFESGKNSVANGYLCKARKCWYFQEQREVPVFICTYMGRASSERDNAFRFILNNSRATVTNSYLALYPRKNLSEIFSGTPSMKRAVWEMLNALTSDSLREEGRVYGGGLLKIEPKELLNVDAPFLARLLAF